MLNLMMVFLLQDVYKRSIRCTIAGVVQGINATVFAYGSTGRYSEILHENFGNNRLREISVVNSSNLSNFEIQIFFIPPEVLLFSSYSRFLPGRLKYPKYLLFSFVQLGFC